jgi:hypothetical protein
MFAKPEGMLRAFLLLMLELTYIVSGFVARCSFLCYENPTAIGMSRRVFDLLFIDFVRRMINCVAIVHCYYHLLWSLP